MTGADVRVVSCKYLLNKQTLNNDTGKYDVTMSILGKREEVGSFDTDEEARQSFIDYKQDYIRKYAKKCKDKVPNKTYQAMLNWTIEITE